MHEYIMGFTWDMLSGSISESVSMEKREVCLCVCVCTRKCVLGCQEVKCSTPLFFVHHSLTIFLIAALWFSLGKYIYPICKPYDLDSLPYIQLQVCQYNPGLANSLIPSLCPHWLLKVKHVTSPIRVIPRTFAKITRKTVLVFH